MDMYTVKLKILDEIANSTPLLQPRDTHISGNWHIQSFNLYRANFPFVTVRMQTDLIPMWSRRTPTIAFGELYNYTFSIFVFGESMSASRALADVIIDYFQTHNKYSTEKIIDIVNFNSKESILQIGPRKYWRTIVTFDVLTEEALT